MWLWVLCVAAAAVFSAEGAGAGAARLICYVENARASDFTECTHLVYAGDARGEKLDVLLKDYRKNNPRLKIVLRVSEVDKSLPDLLKSKHVQGLEIHDAHKSFNKSQVLETVAAAREAISSSGGGPLFLALPAHPELLAKYYDLRALMKKVDLLMVQTHALGMVKKMTYHPSRLSGLWDMMNTDSVVDLVIGLGVPASKVVISLPATARQFTLQNETLSTPGSPTVDDDPKEIDQAEVCRQLRKGRWTLERDQDLSAPYAFKDKTWISFEDASSVDVKGKYARVRGLAGLALYKADRDTDTPCGPTLRAALTKVLNQQSRAPRAAVLRSLENEILSASGIVGRALDALQVSPYRITQVVDSDGVIHSIREDTRTEFSCSRQGYFVHPRSCARFYRCVKFDQLSPEFTVFEFDCPAGLAFDSRYEVCVWPGSLPNSQACPGSSEIAPVPPTRFVCPQREGYYADPENCRWFFACLDHGKAPLTAYEFRCPFGLGFDAARLKCEWPWLVPACGNIARYEAEAFGFSGAALTGAAGFQGKTADSVNIAGHQSLVSGASLDNLVGIQGGYLSKDDILDTNYIASQEAASLGFAGPGTYQIDDDFAIGSYGEQSRHSYNIIAADDINKGLGLVQTTNYNGGEKFSSGSLILDNYRLPDNRASTISAAQRLSTKAGGDSGKYKGNNAYVGASPKYDSRYNAGAYYRKENTGKYVHNPAGDRAKPYEHLDVPPVPYTHIDTKYTQSDAFDTGRYKGTTDSGSYSQSFAGGYDYPKPAIAFNEEPGRSQSLYKIDGQLDAYTSGATGTTSGATNTYYSSYSSGNAGEYISDSGDYTGAPHVLTAGAVRVGLVGKTSLIDTNYADQGNYQGQTYSQDVVHHTNVEPGVTITQFGTSAQNDGYSYVTNPTSSGVPTTATPLPVTTYKTTYLPAVPKSSIKQVFGYTQPAVTYVQPTIVPVKQVIPEIQVTNYNQGSSQGYEFENKDYSSTYNTGSTGYHYTKPVVAFEDSGSYTTATPSATVISYKPQGFGHQQQTIHKVESVGFEYSTPRPVTEPPFRKLVAYTTGTPETYVQPSAQSYSQQTLHKVESGSVYTPSVDVSSQVTNSAVNYEVPQTVIHYSTPQPAVSVQPVVSTYQPQSYSQQTLHTVDNSKVNTYSQSQQEQGYEYQQPNVYVQSTGIQYSSVAPTVSYQPQSYSSQTVQRYNTQQYVPVSSTSRPVTSTPVTVYENPLIKYTVKATPATYVSPAYTSQAFSQQTIHREDSKSTAAGSNGYEYVSGTRYQQPQTTVYSTAQPSITVQPQIYSQQTLHQVDASQVNNYEGSSNSGYEYSQPAVQFEQKFVSSTPAPAVTSTYRPQTYRQNVVSTTSSPSYLYQLNDVTLNQNPLLTYSQKVEPVTYVKPTPSVFTQSYQPVQQIRTSYVSKPAEYEATAQQSYVSQGYSYSQPETVSNIATSNTASYSDASAVSHQVFHQSQSGGNAQYETGKDVVFVSTTPSTVIYEDHYAEYESPKKVETYKAPDYIPPKQEYQEITYSTASTPTYDQRSSIVQTQDQYDYRPVDYSQQFESSAQFTDSKSSSGSSPNVESVHFSSIPETKTTYQYNQAAYQSPEIQVAYRAEEYLPPVVSTETPVFKSTYRPRTYSTTREYLPPTAKSQYNAPEYLPPVDTYTTQSTARPELKTLEYLPPSGETVSRVVNYESFGYGNGESIESDSRFGTYQDYSVPTEAPIVLSSTTGPTIRKQNIVVETAKSNLLGFGTVGPDAGLVSTSYTTAQPAVSSTNNYYIRSKTVTPTYAPEIVEVTSAPRRTKTKYFRPAVKSTTEPNYYVESTTAYQAPEYLPPSSDNLQENFEYGYKSSTISPTIKYNPYQEQIIVSTTAAPKRKQNIVVETAKSQLLGLASVGTDAGLVSSGSYSTPGSVEVSYSTVPVRQEIVEVTSARVPIRRTKPKVAVVTKINDFNPLLVKKLGAVCSCQSPVLVLKGRRPTVQQQDNEDYSNGYDDSKRGDINENSQKYIRVSTAPAINTVTTVAPVISTFNPIIVPDDSFYQDYQESNFNIPAASIRKDYSESYVSSTPVVSTTERVVRIKPRVKAVTVAPTYKTVLLSEGVTPAIGIQESQDTVSVDSQAFDRYGPGGWRSRDETLQGSIDCQRAGLFRHPKQCNKFYACRWDCTKQRFTLHIFNCPVQLSFDPNLGACNWPSQGPACQGDTLLTNSL